MRQELPPGHFLKLTGNYPSKGEKRAVRYRLYGRDVVSNVGQGRVDPKEIERCRGDSFAVRFGDFDTIKAIAQGDVPTTKRDHINVRPHAIRNLSRFKHADCVAVLKKLLADPDPEIRATAARTLAGFGELAKSAVPLLEKLAKEDPGVRVAAASALRSLKGED